MPPMTVSTIKMQAEQYLRLGDDPPGVRLELVDGEIAVSPSPVPSHSNVILQLGRILLDHVDANDLGEVYADVDTILDEYNVRRPDLLFFTKERRDLVGAKAMEGPPDLTVEVISPSSVIIDRDDKFGEYARAGVPHYWIIDPAEQTFEGYSLIGSRYIATGKARGADSVSLPPFPSLVIPLAKLWMRGRKKP